MHDGVEIRAATLHDLSEILRLNQFALPHVSSLTTGGLRSLFDEAAWFYVAVFEHECAGFLIALPCGTNYRSENYLWFAQRYSSFLYIDRICVSAKFQRHGIASRMYEEVEKFAREGNIPLLTCEINLEPENPLSLTFHDRRGFREVGIQSTEGGSKRVSLRSKRVEA